jgi:hypothetical protein
MSNFMKTRPIGAESFHVDGRTDMAKLIVAFRNSANAPQTRGSMPPESGRLAARIIKFS